MDHEVTRLRPQAAPGTEKRRRRICMPSWRSFTKRVYQCGLYEAQDVLLETDDVDLLCLEPNRGFRFRDGWHRRLLYHDISRALISVNPGLKRVRLTQDYDLFVVLCQNFEELLYVSAIEGWKDHCKTSVCVIEEMWASSIPAYTPWLHALRNFDHVYVMAHETRDALSRATGRPCRWIAGAVDAVRFSPFPDPPERSIDVYSIGRRVQPVHQSLLKTCAQSDLFYMYDSVPAAATHAFDHREHRRLLANIAKRSRCFLVAPAKMNARCETNGQSEIGHRFYEGAAAGCAMLGRAPDSDVFRELFDWEDAVVHVRDDGSDVVDVLRALCRDRCRLRTIGRRNAARALRRHDWVYRWAEILQSAGMAPSDRMIGRQRFLVRLADLADSESAS